MLFSRLHHVCVKIWESCLRLYTALLCLGERDKTKILIQGMSAAQRVALANLKQSPAPDPTGSRVLVVIPYRDRLALTFSCVESLLSQTGLDQHKLMLCLVNNGSEQPLATADLAYDPDLWQLKNLDDLSPFNFSRLNNHAVACCADFDPDYYLFLNNDIEARDSRALARLIGFAVSAPRLGALGCTLLYPDGAIQHLFLAPGIKIAGAHLLRGTPYRPEDRWHASPRPVPAVTGAALLTKASAFRAVGGFDERLATAYQDLDLCLKLQKAGLVNWVLPHVTMTHHETSTRQVEFCLEELDWLYDRWGQSLTANPYMPPRLSNWSERPAYRLGEGAYPWRKMAELHNRRRAAAVEH